MDHQEILKKIISELKTDTSISAVMLMGSVAAETENVYSILKLFILGDKNKLKSFITNNVMVECFYVTQETAQSSLDKSGTEVYRYLGSKIIYDMDGRLIKLVRSAMNKYKKYKASDKDKWELRHYLYGVKSRILTALSSQDELTADFFVTSAVQKITEAIFAINDVPFPPVDRILHEILNLKLIPDPNWFEELYNRNSDRRTETVLKIIDWTYDLL
jgi:hypothetical protein